MITFDAGRPRLITSPLDGYSSAEICENGHVMTGDREREPQRSARFCPKCGVATISACPNCNAALRGDYRRAWNVTLCRPLNYCYSCGAPYPWTMATIQAAKEQAAEVEGLDDVERMQLQGVIDDLAAGGARTELAASRFKRLMKKAGQTVGSGLYKIVVDVASEAAKKAINNL
jgi:hypothetical protein